MAKKCPKCNADNPDTLKFCGECGTQLPAIKDIEVTETMETPKEELTTGSTFAGRYQIIEELGKGGMGRVYKVLDKEVNAKVALKLIKPEIASDKKTIERFRNELKTARDIAHKNVCRMYDLGKEEGAYYITMEYVSGEDLKSFIRRAGFLSPGKAISVANQVCEGLMEAHKLGVVHRDLKPQNIMIDKEGNARIMDFGIARSLRAKGITGSGVMIGTPEYMSPEQVDGKEADQRADIYSLGVILYEMVTGKVPFEGDTPFSIGVKQKSEIPRPPKEINEQIPEDLNRVILKCMEKEKENRYQNVGELHSELMSLEKGIPTTERIIPERKPLTSREITVTFGFKKLWIPAVSLIAIAAITVAIWQLLLREKAPLHPSEKQSIVVISFENQTGDKAYDHLRKIIPNLLITSLEQSGYFQVTTWERMYDLLKQIEKEDSEFIDRDLGFELCRMDGIDTIVLGSFGKAGNMFATDVKVLDVKTKSLLKSASSTGEGEDSILKTQIDDLSKEILKGTGIPEPKIEGEKVQIADITTSSLEAYNSYLMGTELYRKFYYQEARIYLEKAIELDPAFTEAYLELAWTCYALGDVKARKNAFEKAKTFSHKASDKIKLQIEYAHSRFIEPNPEKTLEVLEQSIKKYPKEKYFHYRLGYYYQGRDSKKAINAYNKALELDPDYVDVHNQLGYTYMGLEDFEKASEHLKRSISISPGDANPYDSLAEAYFRMGRLDEAIAKYKEALEIKPDFSSDHNLSYIYALRENYDEAMKRIDRFIDIAVSAGLKGDGFQLRGFYDFWLGNCKRALLDLQQAENLFETVGEERGKAFVNYCRAFIHYDRGELDLSRKYIQGWQDVYAKLYPSYKLYIKGIYAFWLVLFDLEEEKIDSAKARLAEMETTIPELSRSLKKWATFVSNRLHAEISLAEGLLEEAIAVMQKVDPFSPPGIQYSDSITSYNLVGLTDVLARAYQQKGDLDKAIVEYERLITFDPDSKERFLVHPKYHYKLAKLYEEKGWEGKAIEHFEKFLTLWKDADPGIAEVEDAKKRLAGLQER